MRVKIYFTISFKLLFGLDGYDENKINFFKNKKQNQNLKERIKY